VAPGGDCPQFRAFLDRIFAGDAALIGFVQRALGYALAGVVAEHALFFCFGSGGNGKSVLLNTVAHILGGYAAVAPAELLAAAPAARNAADLAFLRGARFAMAPEMERGRRWNEPLIKSLTGGDRITARDAHGALATWRPGFKLFVAGNHAPELAGVDAAIRRRFNLVPFAVTIDDPDPMLLRKLVEEWPGILAWMLEGCRAWQAEGLRPPLAVAAATGAYLAAQDTFGAWLDEGACVAEGATAATADLYASWSAYAAAAQEAAGSKKAFAQALQARGFAPCRLGHAGVRGFRGLALALHDEAETAGNPSASVSAGWGTAGRA
jgi:putative DNA primase/helicase